MSLVRPLTSSSGFILHSRQLQSRLVLAARAASTIAPPKPRLLEKPERFNPPSHPQRIRKKPRTYGAPLSQEAQKEQRRKKYPHMMPPEDSFMFWFLTNRAIHTYISLGILLSLVFGIWFQNFIWSTPYADLLPPNSMFFAHPYRFLKQYVEVYGMHSTYNTKAVMERRRQTVDDVQKRSDYRVAHGLDTGSNAGLFGGWTAKSDAEMMGPGLKTDSPTAAVSPIKTAGQSETIDPSTLLGSGEEVSEERPRRKRKLYFGIW